MFDFKSLSEVEEAIDRTLKDVDLAQKTKSRHELKRQFRLAHQRIETLEEENARLKEQLNLSPEQLNARLLESLTPYAEAINSLRR